jgi:hypothetical protein
MKMDKFVTVLLLIFSAKYSVVCLVSIATSITCRHGIVGMAAAYGLDNRVVGV